MDMSTTNASLRLGRHNSVAIRFFSHFCVWLGLIYLLLALPWVQSTLPPLLMRSLVSISHSLYGQFDPGAVAVGQYIVNPQNQAYLFIDHSCSGINACIGMIAILLAYRAPVSRKLAAAALALLIIQSINVVRISHLFYLIQVDRALFELFHLYIWQPVNLLLMITLFYLFTCYVKRQNQHAGNGRAGTLRTRNPSCQNNP